MTRLRIAIFFGWSVLALPVSSCDAAAQAQREDVTFTDGDVGRQIVEYVQRNETEGFSGAVLAARNGKVVAAVAVGSADLEGQHRNTPATLFEIASVTKQFTAAAVMRLVMDEKLALDDSIAKHLSSAPDNCRLITLEHLLRHTSGIPGSNSQGAGDDINEVLPIFLRGGPVYPPGTHWEYWNQGYAIVSAIISAAASKDYTAYCRHALFEPAGMRSTRFTGDAPPAPENAIVAIGRSARGQPRSALDHPYGSYGFQYRGMGGVVTTVWDLWRWDRALHEQKILDAAAISKLFEPGLNDYAMGWFVKKHARGRLVQSHGGGVRGFAAELRRYPKENALIVVLCNRDDAPLRRIITEIEKILFGDSATPEKLAKRLDAALSTALQGRYKDDRGNILTIEADGPVTRAKIHWSPPNGPVTNAILELDDAGQIMLNDGHDVIALKVERSGDEPAKALFILGRQFLRSE